MSEIELLEASGPWWSPFLGLLLIGLFVLATWALLHPHLLYRHTALVLRRGRAYRRSLRAARHRRDRTSLHHLTFRSPIR